MTPPVKRKTQIYLPASSLVEAQAPYDTGTSEAASHGTPQNHCIAYRPSIWISAIKEGGKRTNQYTGWIISSISFFFFFFFAVSCTKKKRKKQKKSYLETAEITYFLSLEALCWKGGRKDSKGSHLSIMNRDGILVTTVLLRVRFSVKKVSQISFTHKMKDYEMERKRFPRKLQISESAMVPYHYSLKLSSLPD